MKKIFFVIACLFTFNANAALIQHVINGDFETGLMTPWNDGGQWVVTGLDSQTGAFSATVEGNFQIKQTFAAVAATDVNEVSFWMKQPEAVISYVALFYDDASETGDIVSLPNGDWNFFDITAWLDLSKNLVGVGFYGYSGGGTAPDITFLDNVSVTSGNAIPEPSVLALLAGGLLAMGLRRRKA